jgi:hypothetical protein
MLSKILVIEENDLNLIQNYLKLLFLKNETRGNDKRT